MASKKSPITIRLPEHLREELQTMARHEAVRRRCDVTWVGLLQEAAEALLQNRRTTNVPPAIAG